MERRDGLTSRNPAHSRSHSHAINCVRSQVSACVVSTRQVRGTVLRYGRSLGFTRVDIFHGSESGPLVATGRHTKAFSQQGQRLLATDIGVS